MRRSMRRRGQAAVEMAVTMIVLIPIIFYALFLEDLLYYNLEWQEAIVVSPWEGLAVNFADKQSAATTAMRYNRVAYCDHTVAYDSYDAPYDCDDDVHHKAMTAHQCWMGGGLQVTCGTNSNVGANIQNDYANQFNAGGLVHCTARLNVSNWFIINKFATWGNEFISDKRTKDRTDGKDKHDVGKETTTENGWVFGAQGSSSSISSETPGDDGSEDNSPPPAGGNNTDDYFAVLHDPWAVFQAGTFSANAKNPTHPIYQRMKMYYDNTAADGTDAAKNFGDALEGAGLLGTGAFEESSQGDDVKNPEMDFNAGSASRRSNGSPLDYSAGWPDNRQSDTNNARQDGYMGQHPAN